MSKYLLVFLALILVLLPVLGCDTSTPVDNPYGYDYDPSLEDVPYDYNSYSELRPDPLRDDGAPWWAPPKPDYDPSVPGAPVVSGSISQVNEADYQWDNLLTNSTFEATNLLTWSATADQTGNWNATRATQDDETSAVKNTVHSIKLTADDVGGAGTSETSQVSATCTAGEDQTLGVWARGNVGNDSGEGVDIVLQRNGGDWGNATDALTDYTSTAWEWLTCTVASTGVTSMIVALRVKNGANADADDIAYFDGVILVQSDSLTPTSWTLTGDSAHYDFESKIGTYSAVVERTTQVTRIAQGVACDASTPYSAGCWVKCDTASRAVIALYDGTDTIASDYHTGGGAWEFLTKTDTTGAGASTLTLQCAIYTGNALAYFDSPVLVEGNRTNFSPDISGGTEIPIHSWNGLSSGSVTQINDFSMN